MRRWNIYARHNTLHNTDFLRRNCKEANDVLDDEVKIVKCYKETLKAFTRVVVFFFHYELHLLTSQETKVQSQKGQNCTVTQNRDGDHATERQICSEKRGKVDTVFVKLFFF